MRYTGPVEKPVKQRWIATTGKVDFDGKELTYVPVPVDAKSPTAGTLGGIAKSNLVFEDGAITFETKLEEPYSAVQLLLNSELPVWGLVGLNIQGAPYGIQVWRDGAFHRLAFAGTLGDVALNSWLKVHVKVAGSTIRLEVDDVPLCAANFEVSRSPVAFFMQGQKPIKI
jgi:hypothetical protein